MSDTMKKLPLNIRIQKAKNEMSYLVKSMCTRYDLPGSVIGLIVESTLSKELSEQMALVAEQIAYESEKDVNAETGDTDA